MKLLETPLKRSWPLGTSPRELAMMGFNIRRLEFYRWLVQHDKSPDWVGVKRAVAFSR